MFLKKKSFKKEKKKLSNKKQLDVYDVNEISAHCKPAENESRHCPSSEQTNGEHLNISLVSC